MNFSPISLFGRLINSLINLYELINLIHIDKKQQFIFNLMQLKK